MLPLGTHCCSTAQNSQYANGSLVGFCEWERKHVHKQLQNQIVAGIFEEILIENEEPCYSYLFI